MLYKALLYAQHPTKNVRIPVMSAMHGNVKTQKPYVLPGGHSHHVTETQSRNGEYTYVPDAVNYVTASLTVLLNVHGTYSWTWMIFCDNEVKRAHVTDGHRNAKDAIQVIASFETITL